MNTKVRPDGQLLCGERGSCQSLPTNPCGTAFGVGRWQIVQLEQGSCPASLQKPITDGLSAIRPISDENAQRYPLAPGPWQPSSRSTSTLSRGPVTQRQAPGQEQVNGEGQSLPACRALTHLHADLANGPGGIVADRDELRVQVGAQDGHELSWWGKRGVLSRRSRRVSSRTGLGGPHQTVRIHPSSVTVLPGDCPIT